MHDSVNVFIKFSLLSTKLFIRANIKNLLKEIIIKPNKYSRKIRNTVPSTQPRKCTM